MDVCGAYTAERAAALSGVPESTVYEWARQQVLVPAVSATKVQLWSYGDLLALRTIYWLRRKKTSDAGAEIPRTTMRAVKAALAGLRKLDLPLWRADRPSIVVDGSGRIYFNVDEKFATLTGQLAHGDLLDPISPFSTAEGGKGPNLVRPRALLRIVPGKLGGSPHIVDTRLETSALAALRRDGLSDEKILRLYPYLRPEEIADALDLEEQLAHNLRAA